MYPFIKVINTLPKLIELDSIRSPFFTSLVLGIPDGQRVEINPSSQDIRIFDSSGSCTSIFEGNTYDSVSDLFGNSSGTISNYGDNANFCVAKSLATNNSITVKKNGDALVCGFYTDSPTEIQVIMSIQAKSHSEPYTGIDSSSPKPRSQGVASTNIYINTYDSATNRNLLQKVPVDSVTASSCAENYYPNKSESITTNKDVDKTVNVIAGYHEVIVSWSQLASINGSWAQCAWGNSVTDVKGTSPNVSYNSEFYVSRFFANGFALGVRSDNFVAAFRDSNGMNFIAQNGNYGFKVSSSAVQIRIGNSTWKTLKIEDGYLKAT